MSDHGERQRPTRPEGLSRLFVEHADAGDVEGQPALRRGDLALTSTRLVGGGATVEVARRQPDGSWLWVIDQPDVLGP